MYNYHEAIKSDIYEAINDEYRVDLSGKDRNTLEDELNEYLWTDDSVTGNASGSYTFNSAIAKEYVIDNISLAIEAMREFGYTAADIGEKFEGEEWEYLDVTIRCYLLYGCISEVLDEMEEAGTFQPETEEEETTEETTEETATA